MHTYTYTCQAMSVAMLPCRKHDVRLRDKHVPVFSPLFLAQIRTEHCPDQFVPGCDCGGMYWRLLGVCKTSVVGLSPVDNHTRPHCLGPSFRETQMGSSLLRKYTVHAQHGETIAQSTAWVTTRECDKDSDIGDDYK